jgi:bacteriorhodopsin
MSLPRWAWWIIGAVIVLVVLVVFKFDFHAGPGGISVTQGLVK